MAITVQDLIESLSRLPPHAYVVVSSDAEGNSFGYLDGSPSIGIYDEDEHVFYSDDFDDEDDTPVDDEPGFGPAIAVALWPED